MNLSKAAFKFLDITDSADFQHFLIDGATEQEKILNVLFGVIRHFFGDPNEIFSQVKDPRNQNKTLYSVSCLAFTGVLMRLLRLSARRQVGLLLRAPALIGTFKTLFGVAGLPHGDTINDTFSRTDHRYFQKIVCDMVRRLIVTKALDQFRLLDKYFVIAVDGTGVLSFPRRHCPHCLTRKRNGKTSYYHCVLEAKLVTPNGLALSMMTEFVENSGPDPKKQDCELKAFYRLAEKLHNAFPRLPILLIMDGLYACGPVFEICQRHGWGFMIVLKDKDLPSVNEEFGPLCSLSPENRLTWITGKNKSVKQEFRWVEDISYSDSNQRDHCLGVLECVDTNHSGQTTEISKFKWITNIGPTKEAE
jgi:hypothetical protein